MHRQLGMGLAVGGLVLVPLACSWGEEFHACDADPCGSTSAGGASGLGGNGGSSITAGSSMLTTGDAGTTGASGAAAGAEAGESGAAGAGGGPATCDGELLPGDDACVVDEAYAVFVSPSGDDATGDGTRESPFATLQKGADAASEQGKRVYACATAGDYVDVLSLSEGHAGLELYGSFDCRDWSYDDSLRTRVAPDAGVPLSVTQIATSLEVDGFAFESADATKRSTSSVAAEIRTSFGVVLRNLALRAGAGAVGTAGETGRFMHTEQALLDGVDGTEDGGGVTSFVLCPAGDETRGGVGGHPDSTEPSDGLDGLPDHDGSGGEGGVAEQSCVGQDGRDGPDGTDGAGASSRGAVTHGSWVPASGAVGSAGLPGQGGGGGAGAANGGGGSGGAGGCGRAGGQGGGGGGASIALFLLDAEVALFDSEVAAGDGGSGGPGGNAEQRMPEFGSPGEGHGGGCDGGWGGEGGSGGGGGGGAGGISVGILFQGTAPVRTNTTVIAGTEGDGGSGAGADNDGVGGFSGREVDVADV